MRNDAQGRATEMSIHEAAVKGALSSAGVSDAEVLPRLLGRYALLRLMVRGGMGEVYLATTIGIEGAERPCVVKRIRREYRDDASFRARFLDEARVQSQLDDPGVAQVLEATVDDHGDPYVVVEYIEGRSLADVRARLARMGKPMAWADAVAVALELASACAHIHERTGSDGAPLGIVHRDLSPQNVMVGFSGDVKLIDFGTARGDNRRCHTISGTVLAKPGYCAPEVARGEAATVRADIYALGVMLWEMVAGRRFLEGEATDHVSRVSRGELRPSMLSTDATLAHPSEGAVPAELDRIVAWLTEPVASARCGRAREAAQALASLLAQAPRRAVEERSVRARVKVLLQRLYPTEPAATRVEFSRLVTRARRLLQSSLEAQDASSKSASKAIANVDNESPSAPADTPTEFPESLPGTRYRLIRKLGEGSMGVVYEGEHIDLRRKVAIKILHAQHSSSAEFVARFRREARAIAGLQHPNLVQVYDFGQVQGRPHAGDDARQPIVGRLFFVMEKLEGETLEAYLDRQRGVDWRDACEVAIKTCRALEASHATGLVHRDLKPANIFLTYGVERPGSIGDAGLKLFDFGVAKGPGDGVSAIGDEGLSNVGAIFGTPDTMAPEQITGGKVDGRADLYALGCVLFELLTGEMAFDAPTPILLMSCHLREPVRSLRAVAPSRGIPEAVERAVLRAMAKDAADRFGSATEMREALEEACYGSFFAEAGAIPTSEVGRTGHVVKATGPSGETVDVLVDDGRSSLSAGSDGRRSSAPFDDDRASMAPSDPRDAHADDDAMNDFENEAEQARLTRRHRVVAPFAYAAIAGFALLAAAGSMRAHGYALTKAGVIDAAHGAVARAGEVAARIRRHGADDVTNAVARSETASFLEQTAPSYAMVDPRVAETPFAFFAAIAPPSPLLDPVIAPPASGSAEATATSALAKTDAPRSIADLATTPPTSADVDDKLAAHDVKGALLLARLARTDGTLATARVWTKAALAAGELREAHEAALSWIARAPDDEADGLPARISDARALRGLGRDEEARSRVEAALKTHPKSVEARALLHELNRSEHVAHKGNGKHRTAETPTKTPKK